MPISDEERKEAWGMIIDNVFSIGAAAPITPPGK
jgi:hypothetical protein